MPHGAFPAQSRAPAERLDAYAGLVGRYVDRATLERAAQLSTQWGVPLPRVLVATGWVRPHDYALFVARTLGVPMVGASAAEQAQIAPLLDDILDPAREELDALARLIETRSAAGRRVGVATAQTLLELDCRRDRAVLEGQAVDGLHLRDPTLSAKGVMPLGQLIIVLGLAGLVLGALATDASIAVPVLAALTSASFLPMIVVRALALLDGARPPASRAARPRQPARPLLTDAELPVYSLLVPLFHEAAVLPGLVHALTSLDYPLAKLDVLLILEESDLETLAAVRALDLPGFVRFIVVPEGRPRTKPKALNSALPLALGDLVPIYDAEDAPEPEQLRRAAAVLAPRLSDIAAVDPKLAAVQARLVVPDAGPAWLSRQFTLEYETLFGVLLPALARRRLPLPLGGTSNHFRRDWLTSVGAWDSFNVTEDADLGLRIARSGAKIGMIDSATVEEAPDRFGVWLRQRTRWLKGYIQTLLVLSRRPGRLLRELGLWNVLAIQGMVGATVLAALLHPFIYVMLLAPAFGETWPANPLAQIARVFTLSTIAAGYALTVATIAAAGQRARLGGLALLLATLPIYWLLISLAAYRALAQTVLDPYRWEKTPHRARDRPRR